MIHYVKGNLLESQVIINFPTKTDWRRPSEYSYIEQGLHVLYHLNGSYIKAKLESFMVDDMKYCGLLNETDLTQVQQRIIASGTLTVDEMNTFFLKKN